MLSIFNVPCRMWEFMFAVLFTQMLEERKMWCGLDMKNRPHRNNLWMCQINLYVTGFKLLAIFQQELRWKLQQHAPESGSGKILSIAFARTSIELIFRCLRRLALNMKNVRKIRKKLTQHQWRFFTSFSQVFTEKKRRNLPQTSRPKIIITFASWNLILDHLRPSNWREVN